MFAASIKSYSVFTPT